MLGILLPAADRIVTIGGYAAFSMPHPAFDDLRMDAFFQQLLCIAVTKQVGWEGRCCVNGVVLRWSLQANWNTGASLSSPVSLRSSQPWACWIISVRSWLVCTLDGARWSCNCCPRRSHTATIHDFTQQKGSTITAGFSPAQLDGNGWVAGWFPGRYCFTHGERSPLIKFLPEHIDYKG